MSDDTEEPRIWARRDRSVPLPPQRVLGRQMRSDPTEAASKLWWHLRHRLKTPPRRFRRQGRIGRYIADFVSHGARLIIEVDGGQHTTQTQADLERTKPSKPMATASCATGTTTCCSTHRRRA
jgi:very-short-patch-repair endonuclease